jgi:hypothetical protein
MIPVRDAAGRIYFSIVKASVWERNNLWQRDKSLW